MNGNINQVCRNYVKAHSKKLAECNGEERAPWLLQLTTYVTLIMLHHYSVQVPHLQAGVVMIMIMILSS